MASIKKRENGLYSARVNFKDKDGKFKQKRKSGFKTKHDAQQWAMKNELDKEELVKEIKADLLLVDYFENWIKLHKAFI